MSRVRTPSPALASTAAGPRARRRFFFETYEPSQPQQYQVTLLGLDTFDPATMDPDHAPGSDVPAWFLDTDHDATRCFRVCQAFFPKTGAWDNLKRALRAEYEESLWEHLSGTVSALFEAGEQRQVAVKVIDERGNELLVVRALE